MARRLVWLLPPLAAGCGSAAGLNWSAVREDLTTYALLSEPKFRSRRCWGLDDGIWSYCGISAVKLLQLQPGLIAADGEMKPLTEAQRRECPLGAQAVAAFAASFLTMQERQGVLRQLAAWLPPLPALLASRWPLFGLLARLAEADATPEGSCPGTESLRRELSGHAAQRRPVPASLARRLLAAVERAEPAALRRGKVTSGCAMPLAAAWAALAEGEETAARADAALRMVNGSDWFRGTWALWRLLHRRQFGLSEEGAAVEGDVAVQGGFAFNRGFARRDALNIDVAADIIHTDLKRSLPAFFGMDEGVGESWRVGLAYSSNDYEALAAGPELLRLNAEERKLLFVPGLLEAFGEKDQQCHAYEGFLRDSGERSTWRSEVGGMPLCFQLPMDLPKLRELSPASQRAFVKKPEGAWGGRGVEIRFGTEHFLNESCAWQPLEHVQCLNLQHFPEASASPEACSREACVQGLATWNWRAEEGCWAGTSSACSDRSPAFLGGWVGGHRQGGRAVLQEYVLDPVVYTLEGVVPEVRVKTDVRLYGTLVSLDPPRAFLSKRGYFRTGWLEENYSATNDRDFESALAHVTHHIPKIERGSYQCPRAPSWGRPEDAEKGAGSGGSLRKWFEILESQNGLSRKEVWRRLSLAMAAFLLALQAKLSCDVAEHSCGSLGFQFFADFVVDSKGRAWLMEVHPTLSLKSHGLGDPEAGWVEVLTRETRQAAMGTLGIASMAWSNRPFLDFAEQLLRRRLLRQPAFREHVRRARRLLRGYRKSLGPGGEARTLEGLLGKMLLEEHMACRLDVEPLLPARWRQLQSYFSKELLPWKLRALYRLVELARREMTGRRAPGDLRSRRCVALDFNRGAVWEQPWERASRRFPM